MKSKSQIIDKRMGAFEKRLRALELKNGVRPLALRVNVAAEALGIGLTKLWQLCNLDDDDPRKIRRTSYGIPVSELQRHLEEELKGK